MALGKVNLVASFPKTLLTIKFNFQSYLFVTYTYSCSKSYWWVINSQSEAIVYSGWECGCKWYKKTFWSDKHVQIVFAIGNVQ